MVIKSQLKIAICGIRGIPASYGGFETFAEELSTRLVEKGHEVTVYGRSHYINCPEGIYKNVIIKILPTVRHKYLETIAHTFLCLIDLIFRRVDVILVCNAANSPLIWISRLFRTPVIVNVDGIERKRAKWNTFGKLWYRLGEYCSVIFSSEIVADAEVISKYYLDKYRANSTVIGYGHCTFRSDIVREKVSCTNFPTINYQIYQELNIIPGGYLLYVSRLEPENNAHVVIRAYNELPTEFKSLPLLIVGDAPYAKDYIAKLKSMAGSGVIFTGYRFGLDYYYLQIAALIYIQATEVGGTHPALVEAMGFGNCIIANSTPENYEVLAGAGLFYKKNDFADLNIKLTRLLKSNEEIRYYRQLALDRAKISYNWELISSEYERLFHLLSK